MHVLAVAYSPAFRSAHEDELRQDWPRIPLPSSKELLLASAALGKQVAALLDSENPVSGITTGTVRADLAHLATITRVGGGTLAANEFGLTAGWGRAGKGGVVMPGRGKLVERKHVGWAGSAELQRMFDVYLNESAFWKDVPEPVWEFTIGGYQVIKKWLSYRELVFLGRPLSLSEIREVTSMARRIAAIVLIQAALNENYREVTATPFAWLS